MPKADIFTTAFYDKWMWKAHREGEARALAALLRTDIVTIRKFITRRHLNWRAYGKDIRKLPDHDHAWAFLVDLLFAKDPAAFLRRKFGHGEAPARSRRAVAPRASPTRPRR